jgi:hypothetical protein
MTKFDPIIEKYRNKGVSNDNIEYAIESVKYGTKREHILESLTADYRGMNETNANSLLEELFAANGGEFKKENRTGYLYGAFFLMIGLLAAFYVLYVFMYGGVMKRPVTYSLIALSGTGTGLLLIIKAIRGKYRDTDDPFTA